MYWFVGADLGQSCDHSAIAGVEQVVENGEWDQAQWTHARVTQLRVRYLERVPLGTPYPEVVEQVVKVTRSPELQGRCQLAVDATGVGRPVVDMLRNAGTGCEMFPVIITGGDVEHQSDGYYKVPKRDLIVGMQVLLQRGVLQIAGGLEWGAALLKEMAGMQVRVSASGREQYGAWREGTHDDLVFAVALACWSARRRVGPRLLGRRMV